ncbi:hypothetical protein Rsub_05112 [Raphidocelis subcapitata]|uniref:Uncharacterized protein n=1 Tax=Raphidocelis subcapitata TaxID=307507 RepID=A0A2V0P4G0_9CHLO|nr:hypothetical protein Rsub_05112 [Raphidocelis subcapitata]|eukprot:GBF92743.1 hypothetical protein Rsub_05112 [Raphidocelis subcapitata]
MAAKLVKGWMALKSPRGGSGASGGSGSGAAAAATPERRAAAADRSGRSTPANRTPRKGGGVGAAALDVDSAGCDTAPPHTAGDGGQLAAAQALLAAHIADLGRAPGGGPRQREQLPGLVEALISEHRLSLLEQRRLRAQLGAATGALASANAAQDRLAAAEAHRAEEVARVRGDLEATNRKLQRLQEARAVGGARIVVPPPEAPPSFLRPTASSASKAVQAAPRGGSTPGPDAPAGTPHQQQHQKRSLWGSPAAKRSPAPQQQQHSPLPAREASASSVGSAASVQRRQRQQQQDQQQQQQRPRRLLGTPGKDGTKQEQQQAAASLMRAKPVPKSPRAATHDAAGLGASGGLAAESSGARSSDGGWTHTPRPPVQRGRSAAEVAAAAGAAAWEGWLGGRGGRRGGAATGCGGGRRAGNESEESGISAAGGSRPPSQAQQRPAFRVERRPWLRDGVGAQGLAAQNGGLAVAVGYGDSLDEAGSGELGGSFAAGECSSPQILERSFLPERRGPGGAPEGGAGAAPRASHSGSRGSGCAEPDPVASCAAWLVRGGGGSGTGSRGALPAEGRPHAAPDAAALCSISLAAIPRKPRGPAPNPPPAAAESSRGSLADTEGSTASLGHAFGPGGGTGSGGASLRASGESSFSAARRVGAAGTAARPPTGRPGPYTRPGLQRTNSSSSGGGGSSGSRRGGAAAAGVQSSTPPQQEAQPDPLRADSTRDSCRGGSGRSSARSSGESFGSEMARRKLRVPAPRPAPRRHSEPAGGAGGGAPESLGSAIGGRKLMGAGQQAHHHQQPRQQALPQPPPQQQQQQQQQPQQQQQQGPPQPRPPTPPGELGPLAAAAAARRASCGGAGPGRAVRPAPAMRSPSPRPPTSGGGSVCGDFGPLSAARCYSGCTSGSAAGSPAADPSPGLRRNTPGPPTLPLSALARAQSAEADARRGPLQRLQGQAQAGAAAAALQSRDMVPLLSQPVGSAGGSHHSLSRWGSLSRAGSLGGASAATAPAGTPAAPSAPRSEPALSAGRGEGRAAARPGPASVRTAGSAPRSPLTTPPATPRAGGATPAASRPGSALSQASAPGSAGGGGGPTPRSGRATPPRGASFLTLKPAHMNASHGTKYAMYSPLRNNLRSLPGSTRTSPAPSMAGDASPRSGGASCGGASGGAPQGELSGGGPSGVMSLLTDEWRAADGAACERGASEGVAGGRHEWQEQHQEQQRQQQQQLLQEQEQQGRPEAPPSAPSHHSWQEPRREGGGCDSERSTLPFAEMTAPAAASSAEAGSSWAAPPSASPAARGRAARGRQRERKREPSPLLPATADDEADATPAHAAAGDAVASTPPSSCSAVLQGSVNAAALGASASPSVKLSGRGATSPSAGSRSCASAGGGASSCAGAHSRQREQELQSLAAAEAEADAAAARPQGASQPRQRWQTPPRERGATEASPAAGSGAPPARRAVPAAVLSELFGSESASQDPGCTASGGAGSVAYGGCGSASADGREASGAAAGPAAGSCRRPLSGAAGEGEPANSGSGAGSQASSGARRSLGPLFDRGSVHTYSNPVAAASLSHQAREFVQLLRDSLLRSDEALSRGRGQHGSGGGGEGAGESSPAGAARAAQAGAAAAQQRAGGAPDACSAQHQRRRRRWQAAPGSPGRCDSLSPAEGDGAAWGVAAAPQAAAENACGGNVFENPLFASKAFDTPSASLG